MTRMVIFQLALILIAVTPCAAQMNRNPKEQEAIKSVALHFQEAWNRHDIKALAALLTDDVDFITVAGIWQKSREEFELHHAKLHEIQMKNSVLTIRNTEVKFIRSDVAVAHVEWGIRGDKDADGTPREPRQGIFTWVLEKRNAKWSIIASQNVNLRLPVAAK